MRTCPWTSRSGLPIVTSGWRPVSWAASLQGFHWWLLLVGGWLVLWTGYLIVKALVLVHAVVWAVPPPADEGPAACLDGGLARP